MEVPDVRVCAPAAVLAGQPELLLAAIWVVSAWWAPSRCWLQWCNGPTRVVLTGRISVVAAPWLTDHAVEAVVLFPGTRSIEVGLAGR